MPTRIPPLLLVAAFTLGTTAAFAAPEIKLQGKSRTTGAWSEIEDDDGGASSDSPRGGNGTEFGGATLGQSKTRDFRVQNNGNETLTISAVSVVGADYEVLNLSPPVSVSAGSDREFQIRFAPDAPGRRVTRITIDNNEGSAGSSERRTTFRVGGDAEGPELSISGGGNTTVPIIVDGVGTPAPGDVAGRYFGPVDAAAPTGVTNFFTLNNLGNKALNLSNPRFTGPGADVFTHSQVNAGINLGAGNQRAFRIDFSPVFAGTYDATFTVDTNDLRPGRQTYTFAVRGVAFGAPEMRVRGQDRNTGFFNVIDPDEPAPRDGNGTEWGGKNIANSPHTHTFQIINDGTDALVVTSVASTNPIVFAVDPLQATVLPGFRVEFDVEFNPAEAKDYDARIQLRTDDPAFPFFSFPVAGRGTGLGIDPPEMELDGWRVDPPGWVPISSPSPDSSLGNGTEFPTTLVGASYSGRFRIRNVSAASDLTFDRSASTTEYPSIFAITGLPANVGAGRDAEFQIVFTPEAAGPRFAFVNLFNNDPDLAGRFTFGVFGQGATPPPPTPKVQLFGGAGFRTEIGHRDERVGEENGTVIVTPAPGGRVPGSTFRVFNAGDEALTIDASGLEGPGRNQFEIGGLPVDGGDDPVKISPLEYAEFIVNYNGPPGGEFETVVLFACNDPDIPVFQFTVASAAGPGLGADLAITEVVQAGATLILHVDAAAGVRFHIEASTGLGTWGDVPGFSGLAAGMVPINGAIAPGVPVRLYRAVQD